MPFSAMIAVAAAAAAPGLADLDRLDRDIALFAGAPVGAPGGAVRPLDRRLRLAECAQDATLEWRTAARDTIIVRCPDAGGWHLFVPIMASAARQQAAAQAGPPAIARGDVIALAVTGSGFSVSRPAEALEGGAVGQWIRVRPVTDSGTSQVPVRAQVVRPGLVALPANSGTDS